MRKTNWYWNDEEDRPINTEEWENMRKNNRDRNRKRAIKKIPISNKFWKTIAKAWEESK